jgi:hypothetical protein
MFSHWKARVPVRLKNRGVRGAGCLAALTVLVAGCSLGGESDAEPQDAGEQTAAGDTGPDVEALRAAWADAVDAACTERDEEYETLARALPDVVERDGLAVAAEPFAAAEATLQESVAAAEPAPGDEAQVDEMTALYQEAGDLTVQAVGAKYAKGDRRFYALMAQADEASAAADAIATELGAEGCATEPAGPYATVDGLAAVRWGDRASQLCRARDKAFMSFRPTDTARYEATTRRWLRRTRALGSPEQYAPRIKRFLDKYAASLQAQKQAAAAYSRGDIAAGEQLTAKGNRLVSESTEIMYDIGFAIGFDRYCSAKPG